LTILKLAGRPKLISIRRSGKTLAASIVASTMNYL
jgi:hypothetical protein